MKKRIYFISKSQTIIAIILTIAALKLSQTILLPITISIFLALLLFPVIHWLEGKKVPTLLSSLLSLGVVFIIMAIIGYLATVSFELLMAKKSFYEQRFQHLLSYAVGIIRGYGIPINQEIIRNQFDLSYIFGFLGKGFLSVFTLLKYAILIFFTTLFILLESKIFKRKALEIFDTDNNLLQSFQQISIEVQRYIFFKTMISFATGALVWLFLKIMGVDFPLIWGLITFLLNFIPSVGSIIATTPPVLMSLIQFENPLQTAVIILIGLGVIQLVLGSYLDPRIMGQNLNISTLVVFLSMVFWGFIWGPVGMLLAVPLTVIVKVSLTHYKSTRNIAKMLEGK